MDFGVHFDNINRPRRLRNHAMRHRFFIRGLLWMTAAVALAVLFGEFGDG